MAEKNRTTLKEYFEVGDKPTENQFIDLIDSSVNRTDDDFVETVSNASTTQKGIAERATLAEVQAATDDTRFVTPKGVKSAIDTFAPMQDTGWQIPPQLNNGFVNYGGNWQTVRYRKKNGVVYLEGMVKNGIPDPAPMFILPQYFRPSGKLLFSAIGNNVVSRVNIDNTGIVTVSNLQTQWTSISGISFIAD